MFIFDSLLKIVPGDYYGKWNLALFSFYFFSLSALFVSLYSPLINFFNAIGKVKTSLYFMVYFTVITWILIPLFIQFFGFNGISIAFFVMSLSFIFIIFQAKKYLSFPFLTFIHPNIIAAVTMAGYLLIIRVITLTILDSPLLHVVLSVTGGVCIFFYVTYLVKGKALYQEIIDLIKLKNHNE